MELIKTIKHSFLLGLKESPAVFFAPVIVLYRAIDRSVQATMRSHDARAPERRQQPQH